MKKKLIRLFLSTIIGAAFLTGCGQAQNQPEQEQTGEATQNGSDDEENGAGNQTTEEDFAASQEDIITTAMYVPIAEDAYIFVDQENNTVFTITFPEEITDINGNNIAREELEKGNIVKIHGNGIMLESYPGQYPGISKIEVIEEGSPADADQYQTIVDEIYQEPDPAEPPTLNVEYRTDMVAATVMIGRGGYEWTYVDKDGLSNAVVADSAHVLNWDQLADIKMEEPISADLVFSQTPMQVEVVRYESDLIGTEQIPEGEKVEVEETQDIYVIPQLEAGYVYEITGIWENGRATYGFLTLEP